MSRYTGAETVLSKANPDELNFGQKFDLIFCGSLFTHLPEKTFRSLLKKLSESLSDTGIAIITLHGRYSEHIQKNKPDGWNYLADHDFGDMNLEAEKFGFGYRDYDAAVRDKLFGKQPSYGISFSRPMFTMGLVEEDYSIRILGYIERGWHNHQDVLVFGKSGINQTSI